MSVLSEKMGILPEEIAVGKDECAKQYWCTVHKVGVASGGEVYLELEGKDDSKKTFWGWFSAEPGLRDPMLDVGLAAAVKNKKVAAWLTSTKPYNQIYRLALTNLGN
ncbi:hypothetical protein [Nocardia fluminea]|uniref:hypothetical protein n=1 Tax=Nocardia fluminea TaxID=134984 RepID=UPI003D0FC563